MRRLSVPRLDQSVRSPRVAVDPPCARRLRKASESGRNGSCHCGRGKTHKNCHGFEGEKLLI